MTHSLDPAPARHTTPRRDGNWLILLAVVALTLLPLFIVHGDFEGADGKGSDAVTEVQPAYEPWFSSLMEPPSGEIESLLFVSQAAIGAGVIGYLIGLYKGRSSSGTPS
ncbi:energy-coupling factor ABC transporter substrate-binding protein [Synechococcus sp. RSCCF101]|uniref:energy-coupling factor ABC transporter substrate-binding protein n=1 Tax=Synechococcus sp. RSCCF101 TaxID=2511069 RepID=UPI001244F5D6|nr:energy-coupling factor ABC transporter substrate-binding protein [Synechococcus sp. RSCCF101]QEY32215.1 energy-coupling factor ABC transporter substrate-binding protein [Synechococcus sp. RSCCF101]